MEAPKCRNIPSCGKRHYGECSATSGNAAAAEREPALDEPRGKIKLPAPRIPVGSGGLVIAELAERVEMLEQIVDELLAGKRKRSEYMKQYMRDRRARDGG